MSGKKQRHWIDVGKLRGMQFGVLGALQAAVREYDVHIGSPKLRIVLACLIPAG